MKNQSLFSSKDKIKKLRCRLLQFLFGALRVKALKMNEFANGAVPYECEPPRLELHQFLWTKQYFFLFLVFLLQKWILSSAL